MRPVDHVRQHDQELRSPDKVMWEVVGLQLACTAFEAKAYYTIGLVREMLETSGLARMHGLHFGEIFPALDALELIGRAVGGFRQAPGQAGARLRAGLQFALDLNANEPRPLVVLTVDGYSDLRNFVGHGAASSSQQISFDPWTGPGLLHLTARALDAMWADSGAMAKFAECQIDPLFTASGGPTEPIYLRDVQQHLQAGRSPSAELRFDDWQREPVRVQPSV